MDRRSGNGPGGMMCLGAESWSRSEALLVDMRSALGRHVGALFQWNGGNRRNSLHVSPSSSVPAASSSSFGSRPALWHVRFHRSASCRTRSSSFLSLSTLVLSSTTTWSVSNFSWVHLSMFLVSFALSCWMYSTARCNIEPLFFSHPGTIFAISLMPSLMVSRRLRSTKDIR